MRAIIVLGVGVLLVMAYCTGARLQAEHDAQLYAEMRAAFDAELNVIDNEWADCLLQLPIRFPFDTTKVPT